VSVVRTRLFVVVALSLLATGCRPKKPPTATRVWLGSSGGCVATPKHETSGTFACWGANDAGQIGDGTTTSRPFANRMPFEAKELALGARHSCGVFDTRVQCWGDGSRGQLGAPGSSLVPRSTSKGDEEGPKIAVAVGGAHTCIAASSGDRLRCFGAEGEGQLGPWPADLPIRSFALGAAHTCVAYSKSAAGREQVVCRGRSLAAPRDAILGGVAVKELGAGDEHTCALIDDGTVRCWGKNDAGQLGDGTTTDSPMPVSVPDLYAIIQVVGGRHHTCALLHNGTVACWGANESHQLSIGTTERSTRPRVVVGLVGAKELAAAGDGTCARLEGGYVRCWGRNDGDQLGGGSRVEHSVPVQIQFR
jgi:alpha-tubulin suppressor-like RCC1 family protein